MNSNSNEPDNSKPRIPDGADLKKLHMFKFAARAKEWAEKNGVPFYGVFGDEDGTYETTNLSKDHPFYKESKDRLFPDV